MVPRPDRLKSACFLTKSVQTNGSTLEIAAVRTKNTMPFTFHQATFGRSLRAGRTAS